VYVSTPVDEFTEQPVVPALVTAYEIVPSPDVVANADGVAGDATIEAAS
jgi:hypothetical protein